MLAIRYARVSAESNSQMMEFDEFGPLARAAFNYGPRNPDVKTFRSAFAQQWHRNSVNSTGEPVPRRALVWTDPDIDAAFAQYIYGILEQRVGQPSTWRHLEPRRLLRGSGRR